MIFSSCLANPTRSDRPHSWADTTQIAPIVQPSIKGGFPVRFRQNARHLGMTIYLPSPLPCPFAHIQSWEENTLLFPLVDHGNWPNQPEESDRPWRRVYISGVSIMNETDVRCLTVQTPYSLKEVARHCRQQLLLKWVIVSLDIRSLKDILSTCGRAKPPAMELNLKKKDRKG